MTQHTAGSARFFARRTFAGLVALALLAGSAPAEAGGSVETSGDVLAAALPVVAFTMSYDRHDADGRRQFLKAFGANLIGTFALKGAVNKERPDGSGNDAFPSGHTSVAFQAAAFIHRRYGGRPAWPLYAVASYVGWTRVDAKKHDTSDVVAGAALGIASSFWLVERAPSVAVTPLIGDDFVGVRFAGRF